MQNNEAGAEDFYIFLLKTAVQCIFFNKVFFIKQSSVVLVNYKGLHHMKCVIGARWYTVKWQNQAVYLLL